MSVIGSNKDIEGGDKKNSLHNFELQNFRYGITLYYSKKE